MKTTVLGQQRNKDMTESRQSSGSPVDTQTHSHCSLAPWSPERLLWTVGRGRRVVRPVGCSDSGGRSDGTSHTWGSRVTEHNTMGALSLFAPRNARSAVVASSGDLDFAGSVCRCPRRCRWGLELRPEQDEGSSRQVRQVWGSFRSFFLNCGCWMEHNDKSGDGTRKCLVCVGVDVFVRTRVCAHAYVSCIPGAPVLIST